MAKSKTARVTLRDSLSHTRLGRKFVKGKPQIVTEMSEIRYYKAQAGFKVKTLKKKDVKKSAPKKDKIEKFDKSALKSKSKNSLTKLAVKWGILLAGEESKSDLVDAILEIQKFDK